MAHDRLAGCGGSLMDRVRITAPAKVNLRLRVLAREASGYHSLETVFCAISLADTLTVRRSELGIRLVVDGEVDTGPPGQNLVMRAAERFQQELATPLGVQIHLQKRIPSGAGLGGGSSDAAACLRALNALLGEPLSPKQLLQMGAELGSDVPFFLCGSPLALAWSRGERLLPLQSLPERPVLIAHPGEPIATADAFARIAERRAGVGGPEAFAFPAGALGSWEASARIACNDFEAPATKRIPRLRDALAALREHGAPIAMLTGSGSAVFGVFPDVRCRDAAALRVQAHGLATWSAFTLREMPAPLLDLAAQMG
jgi:4-diphosphocytidyl-2-C-methyl-D-erythritol kinase